MGMFNAIHAALTCPVTGNPLPNADFKGLFLNELGWDDHDGSLRHQVPHGPRRWRGGGGIVC
jgi:hypothetical protein